MNLNDFSKWLQYNSEKFKGVWILSVPTVCIYIYIYIYDTRVFDVHIIPSFRVHIWNEICWRAYDMQFSRTYDTHLPHNPNPTHRVAYTGASQ